jgi:small subunit ribosomal protein S36
VGRPSRGGGPIRRALATVPRTVWLIVALWGALLLGASVLWPMSYGYDEPAHIDMAYVYSANPFHFYGPGQLSYTKANVAMQALQPGYPLKVRLDTAPILPRGQRPSFAQLGGHTPAKGSQPNQMVQHPPLYYWMEAAVLRVPGMSGLAWDLQVWIMRLLSVVLMLPVPLLCWATARRLLIARMGGAALDPDRASRLAVLAAVVPLTVPNMIRDGSSVTNDTLLILTTSVVLYLISRVMTGDLSRRTAAWLAVALAAALLTKGLALILPLVILAAYLVGGWRRRPPPPTIRSVGGPLLIVAVGAVVGGLWWLRNLIDYGTVQVDGYGTAETRVLYGPPDHKGTLLHFLPAFTSGFISRIWGGIGIPDTPNPGPVIIYGWFIVVLVGVVAALVVKGRAGERVGAAVLLAITVLTFGVVAEGSLSIFRQWSNHLTAEQGRYIYSTIAAPAALAALGWIRMTHRRVHTALAPIVLIAAVVTNAVVWLMILRTWYQPANPLPPLQGLRDAIHGLLRWSPLPEPVTILLVMVLPAVTAVLAVVGVVEDTRRWRRALAEDSDDSHPAVRATV